MISELIQGHYKSNPISVFELMDKTNLSKRQVEQRIHDERCAGEIIAANSKDKGYYCPVSSEELEEYIQMSSHRAVSTLRALRAARRKLSRMRNEEMFDGHSIESFEKDVDYGKEKKQSKDSP